ncbi:DUF6544 family protein [Sorangium sp. So ce136]
MSSADATSAKATMRHAGKVASAVLTFDPQGRVELNALSARPRRTVP